MLNRALAFRKSIESIKNIPSLAAQARTSGAALSSKFSPAHKYSAAVLAVAATAVAIAPITASADASHATKTAAVSTAKPAAKASAAKPAAKAPAAKTTTEAAKPAAPQTKAAAPKTEAAKPAAQAAPQTKAAAPAKAYAGVSMGSLEPTGTVGYQSHITLDSAQWQNATTIVNAAHDLGLSPYAATIAVATAMQESKLQNLTVAVDHDSLGLFQQRPSTGWGTPSELEDPTYAAKAFLKSLPSGYEHMSLHTAAQDVQRSFDGYLYAQWEDQAAQIVHTIAS